MNTLFSQTRSWSVSNRCPYNRTCYRCRCNRAQCWRCQNLSVICWWRGTHRTRPGWTTRFWCISINNFKINKFNLNWQIIMWFPSQCARITIRITPMPGTSAAKKWKSWRDNDDDKWGRASSRQTMTTPGSTSWERATMQSSSGSWWRCEATIGRSWSSTQPCSTWNGHRARTARGTSICRKAKRTSNVWTTSRTTARSAPKADWCATSPPTARLSRCMWTSTSPSPSS